LVSRRLYEILGLACGFVLIDYGFNFVAAGFPGAREVTSQFVGANLIVGGSAAVFVSLYYLLRPIAAATTMTAQASSAAPDVGVETIVEEETPPKSSFYRNIAYVGYFFTILGLFSAADLVLQVFLRSIYNEARWWVEVLLVTFGVLSFTIFGSIGRLGSQEEAMLTAPLSQPKLVPENVAPTETAVASANSSYPESLEVRIAEFTKSSSGEYERHLSGETYDMLRIERDVIAIWREDRKGMRSVYLAGPYELDRKLLEEHMKSGEELKIGSLSLSVDSMRELQALQERPAEGTSSPAK
jgi:hypothetical protein